MQSAKQVDVLAADAGERTYVFGCFRLLPSRQLLLREGVPVRVGTRALEILTLLVSRVGKLVTKEDLTSTVWPNTFVHESNLKVHVAALRRVLDEASTGTSYIATVPGRGYRFIVPVEEEQSQTTSAARFRRTDVDENFPKLRMVIGRSDEITLLAEQLTATRCVSIVGPGGAGKTTVAVAVAHHVRRLYEDGIRFVDLSTVADAQYVPAAIATAVGAQLGVNDVLSSAVDVLRDRQLLLVLDNCEHLSSAVATAVGRIHAAAPEVGILATSREPIRTGAEHIYRLPTLAFPADDASMTASLAMEYPAVELFVARAAEKGDYVLTDVDAPSISAICRRLDGLALAIELAAGKIQGSDPASILEMLERRFQVLSYGPRDAPLRQQALATTLDWSYQLLADHEATVLRHLSVFVGYFSADDAVAMCEGGDLDPADAIDALGQLVAKSLVVFEYLGGAVRYRLLESTRAYAGDRLAAQAEQRHAQRRFAVVALSLVERSESEWFWRVKRDWMSEFADRIGDLRKAIAWAFCPTGERLLGVRLAAAAIPLWDELSLMREARARVDEALVALQGMDTGSAALRMKLAASHAWSMTFARHLLVETETAWLDCIRFASEGGNVEYQLRGLWGLSVYLMYTGRHLESLDRLERFKALSVAEKIETAVPDGERLLANAEIYVGRLQSAVHRLEALASQHDRVEERSRITRFQVDRYVAIRGTFSFALWLSGAPTRAAEMARQAIEGALAIEHVASQSTALALWILPVTYWAGDLDRAERLQAMLDENNHHEEIAIWLPVSRFFRGALDVSRGDRDGIGTMRHALDELTDGRFVGRTPMYQSMLAEALLTADGTGEAAEMLEQARSTAIAQDERWCLPEIIRMQGVVALRQDRPGAAEVFLGDALLEAKQIGAGSLELRIVLTLSDKWKEEGRFEDARDLLSSIIPRFEGEAGYPDLESARTRLDILQPGRNDTAQ